MDILNNLENIDSLDAVNLTDPVSPDEIIHNAVIRTHLYVIIIGLFLTLFMVLL